MDDILEEQLRSILALDLMMSRQTKTTQSTRTLLITRSKRNQKKNEYPQEFNGTGKYHGYTIYKFKDRNKYIEMNSSKISAKVME